LVAGTQGDRPLVVNTYNFPGVQRCFGNFQEQETKPVGPNFGELKFENYCSLKIKIGNCRGKTSFLILYQ